MKKYLGIIAMISLIFCGCNEINLQPANAQSSETSISSAASSSDAADVSILFEAQASIKFSDKYICTSDYFKDSSNVVPWIAFYEDGSCEMVVNYLEGVSSIFGMYTIAENQIMVNVDLYDTIFEESGTKYIDDQYVFEIVSDNEIVIDRGYYAVKAGDCFIKS